MGLPSSNAVGKMYNWSTLITLLIPRDLWDEIWYGVLPERQTPRIHINASGVGFLSGC